jgi:hypothetical protein
LVTFLEDMPHIEAAARGEPSRPQMGCYSCSYHHAVSVSGLITSISTLVTGLNHIQNEVRQARGARVIPTQDRFVDVMEVSSPVRTELRL